DFLSHLCPRFLLSVWTDGLQRLPDEDDEDDFISSFRNADFGTGNQKRTLGEDVFREHFEGWEQVTIPAKTPLPRAEYESELKSITEIDIWARPAFSGVTQFNRMQSRCLGPAYSTNENLLVCAPTGAGNLISHCRSCSWNVI
ncbi:hypothetical protein BVRB_021340, partial [Beta vulgaris subsp. vulgaris]